MPPIGTGFPGILMEVDWVQASKDHQQRQMFLQNTMNDLTKIHSYPLGRDLLELIRKRHQGIGTSGSGDDRTVTIRMGKDDVEGASTNAWVINAKFRTTKRKTWRKDGKTVDLKVAGAGSRTIIYYHNLENSDQIYTRLCGVRTPTFITLAHELIHAWHHLGGNTYEETVGATGEIKYEEMFTTGLGPFAKTRISENAIRAQANLPHRPHYYFPGDAAQVRSLAFPNSPTFTTAPPRGFWRCTAFLWGLAMGNSG